MPGRKGRRTAAPKRNASDLAEAVFDEPGEDTEGRKYDSLAEMWSVELADRDRRQRSKTAFGGESAASDASAIATSAIGASTTAHNLNTEPVVDSRWYKHAAQYWETQSADVEGMLGGFGELTGPDVKGSQEFIKPFVDSGELKLGRCLDVGAGVGRVTKEFLVPVGFEEVDLLEQNPHFLEIARDNLSAGTSETDARREHKGEFFCAGMQNHEFGERTYDCIWIQWCIIYLSDDDFIAFFAKCKKSLRQGGIIVLKDNCTQKGFIVDRDDSSITRSEPHLRWLFAQSGLDVIKVRTQTGFPKKLFPVKMFAMR